MEEVKPKQERCQRCGKLLPPLEETDKPPPPMGLRGFPVQFVRFLCNKCAEAWIVLGNPPEAD